MDTRRITPEQALRDTHLVLTGKSQTAALDETVAKVIRIMLSTDADIRVDGEGFFVQYRRRRFPFSYFPGLASQSIAHVLRAASFELPVNAPQRRILSPSALPTHRFFESMDALDRTVWVHAEATTVRMYVRQGIVEELCVIPDWKPDPKVFVELHEPYVCPRCKRTQTRYREVSDALICLACGGSFVVDGASKLAVLERVQDDG